MRILVVFGLLVCLFLSGCEFFTPNTSSALSQTKQMEELQNQTKQLKRQADALEQLANSVKKDTPEKSTQNPDEPIVENSNEPT